MTKDVYTLQAFLDELDRLGGDLAHWPSQLRLDAEALLATSVQARAGLEAMRKAEAVLTWTQTKHSAAPDVMAALAMRYPQVRSHSGAVRRLSWAAAGAAALAFGLFVGAWPIQNNAPADFVAAALEQPGGSDVR